MSTTKSSFPHLNALMQVSRRTFLQGSSAAATLAALAPSAANAAGSSARPRIPELAHLASDRITHRFRDLYSTPATQNELGYVKAAKSITGITAISFPPFACCGVPEMAWSPGYLTTCELYLNDRLVAVSPESESTYTWYPHRIVREGRTEGLLLTTQTFMPARQRCVAQSIVVKNGTVERRTFTLGFDLRAAVTRKTDPWFANSPGEADNRLEADPLRGRIVFEAQHAQAVSVQGFTPLPQRVREQRMVVFELTLEPGESRELHYINAIAASRAEAVAMYERAQAEFGKLDRQNEETVADLLRAAFTPGNTEFSGHLPQLITDDEALWNLYYRAFTNLLFARRHSPDSAYGPTYLTLGGRVLPTLSFPWDTSLTSLSLALLDPVPLRVLTETWLSRDMHQHLATDYVSGQAIGPWYAVNDMAIVRCAQNYLRVTGDFAWLDKQIEGKSVLDRLTDHALHWKQLDRSGHGLADYGKIENLLEVVSTYIHEVAGMNAGNVGSMRFVAALHARRGNTRLAEQLRSEADTLSARIRSQLYVEDKGYWRAGQPDGSFFEVRHCYDLLAVLDNMDTDLSSAQKQQMNRFFWDELYSELWMRSLSAADVDATWNIRPDHSSIGAYPSWPPMTAKGLYKIGPQAQVSAWVRQLSRATNQGPIGQAHFVETVFPPEHGGACKSPEDAPYLNDWCCIAAGCFIDLVLDAIFGADLTLHDGIRVRSRVADFDPRAELRNLRYQGAAYNISASGAQKL